MKKNRLKLPLIISVAFAAIIIIALILLHTPAATKLIINQARNQLRKSGLDLSYSRASLNLSGQSAVIDNIVIRSANNPEMPPLFNAQRVHVKVGIFNIIRGRIDIKELDIASPEIHYFINKDGKSNIPESHSPSGHLPDFLISRGMAANGSFRYEDARSQTDLIFPGWQLTIEGNRANHDHHIEIVCNRTSTLNLGTHVIPVNYFKASGMLQKENLQINSFQAQIFRDSQITASGAMRDFSDLEFDMNAESDINLASLSPFIDIGAPMQGRASGTITAKGKISQLALSAQLQGKNFSAGEIKNLFFTLSASAEKHQDKLAIQNFRFDSPLGSAGGNGEIVLDSKSLNKNTITAQLQSIDIQSLVKFLKLDFGIAAKANGEVQLSWAGELSPATITGATSLKIASTKSAPAYMLLPVSGTIAAEMRNNRINGRLYDISAWGARIAGSFSIHSLKEIDSAFHGEADAVNLVAQNVIAFLSKPAKEQPAINAHGPLSFDAQVSGALASPRFTIQTDMPDLQAWGVKHLNAQTTTTIQGSLVKFENKSSIAGNALATATGSLETSGKKSILTVAARTGKIPLSTLLAGFESKIEATGSVSVELNASGPIDALACKASVKGDELSLYKTPIGSFNAKMSLADGKIASDTFRIARDPLSPDSDYIDAAFTYKTDSNQFELQANGKDIVVVIPPGSGALAKSKISLSLSANGTIDQPVATAKIESADAQLHQQSIGPLAITANLQNNALTINADAPEAHLIAETQVETKAPYPFQGKLSLSIPDLSRIGLHLTEARPLAGMVDLKASGSGNLQNIKDAAYSAVIQNLRLRNGDLELRSTGPIRAEYKNSTIAITEPATILSGNSRLEISGKISLQPANNSNALSLKGQVDLGQITGLLAPKGTEALGIMDLNIALSGALNHLNASGSFAMQEGFFRSLHIPIPLTNIAMKAGIRNNVLTLEKGKAEFSDTAVEIEGKLPLRLLAAGLPIAFSNDRTPASFAITIANFRPESAGMLPEGLGSLISLHAEGQSDRLDLGSLKAVISIQDLSLRDNEIEIRQKAPSTILISKGIASIAKSQPQGQPNISLAGPGTSVEITGSAGLIPNTPLALNLAGEFNAALLTFMDPNIKAVGQAKIKIDAAGTINAPQLAGSVEMTGGRFIMRDPRIAADNMNIKLNLATNRIDIKELNGTVNGGSMTASGNVGYSGGTLNHFNITTTLRDFFINFPEGLKSSSDADLTISSQNDSIVVGGTIHVQDSSYRESIEVLGPAINSLKSQQIIEERELSPLLNRVRFNVGLQTEAPLLVQNNVAKIEASTNNLRIVGTPKNPSLIGRIQLGEGGEIVLNGRTYYITRGIITLSNQTQIKPEFDIEAQTKKIGEYEITLLLAGPLERLTHTLTSDPPMPESEIISLIFTGKTNTDSMRNDIQVAPTQALSLLAGQAGEEARQALHLSTFRIDPGLMSAESDTGARLTLGEDITRNFSLAYSMNVMNGGDQTWDAQYDITKKFNVQAAKQSDNTYRFELLHDLRLGGNTQPRTPKEAAQKLKIGAITFSENPGFQKKVLMDKFEAKTGDIYNFPKIQKSLDRLTALYASQKRFEADIRLRRETKDKNVDLKLDIYPGQVVSFAFDGMPVSNNLKGKVEKAWSNGVFDIERIEESSDIIHKALLQEGYLQSKITYQIDEADDHKTVIFHIEPGPKYSNVPITFPGASAISEPELANALGKAGLEYAVYMAPQKSAEFIKRYYSQKGYLQARVEAPQPRLDPEKGSGKMLVPISEGPLFLVGKLEFSGNAAFGYDQLWSIIPVSSGSIFNPTSMQDSTKALESFYQSHGYNDATASYRITQDPAAARANIMYMIVERKQSFIRDIVIEGNQKTSAEFTLAQLDFHKEEPLDFAKIDVSRRRLYSTNVFTSVDFIVDDIPDMPDSPASPTTKNVRIRVRIKETQPYRIQYGFLYDTERGPGGLFEAQNLNFLGRAKVAGLRLRYDSDMKEGRLYFNQPFVTNLHLKMDVTAFAQRETRVAFSATRIGLSLIQEKQLPKKFVLSYGYRYDHVRWEGLPPDPTIFQESVPVARLIATVTRDTRDSILDATTGDFMSHSFEFGPTWLGSETGFSRYFGQYFKYVPLDGYFRKATKDEERKPLPASFVYASALRLGLTSAFDHKSVISPERFFAGGGTTMRGFQQDLMGPVETQSDGTRRPTGGEALFLFNNELRFPIYGILQGVGFVDIGNIYQRLSDFNFNVRKTAGAGLRLKIKFIPFRFDYGFKLDKKPGESGSAFFFSIGQAF